MAAETFEVTLHGGAPWGFRLQGGKEFRAPLLIAKVTPGSKAAKEGIIIGDWLTSINNEPCDDMTHSSALNSIKKTGKELVLTLERRPYDGTGPYSHSTNSLPHGTKLSNGLTYNNEYKSVEGYATLPRTNDGHKHKNGSREDYERDHDAPDAEDQRPSSLSTLSSGISSRYSEDGEEYSSKGSNVMTPSKDEWSPDLISDAVRPPQPIRLVSSGETGAPMNSNPESTRVKAPSTVHGFTDKPAPVGRGARRNNDEEIVDSKDNPLLNSGSAYSEEDQNDDDSASEQPYRRYSYHGSVLKDAEPKSPDATERPRIQAGSGWYKELFKEMHTGAGNSTGLSSLLAGDTSPPKNDARGLFKGYRTQSQDSAIRATKTQDTQADPSSSNQTTRYSRPAPQQDSDGTQRYSTSSLPSSAANTIRTEVQMREKPTTRSNVPSWYKELQKGIEVSEKEIIEDRVRQQKGYQVPGGVRAPGDVGPEYPVVRGFSIGSRPSSGPVVHRDPPQRLNTQTFQQRSSMFESSDRQTKPATRYSAATRNKALSVEPKEPSKPSASNLYEDHMRNRQLSPRVDRKHDKPEPVDYIKQFEDEEKRFKEDERRAKEDYERKLREENRAKEEAEQRRREVEMRRKEEEEARKNPKRARALYNFSPQSAKEIAFRKGDIIIFYRIIDANWCEGEAQGKIGLFPSSYVEILEDDLLKTEGEGRVRYNFKAESPRELNLQKGDIVAIIRQIDKNWYEGVKDDRIGIFPVSYIEVLREPAEKPQQAPQKNVEEQITKQNGIPEVHSAPDGSSQQRSYKEQQMFDDMVRSDEQERDINNLDGERFTVVFSYAPQNEDELELQEGDLVKVVEKCDDGWFVGISERTGDFGTFPGNYVKQIA